MVDIRVRGLLKVIVLLAVADIVASLIENATVPDVNNNLKGLETRRKGRRGRKGKKARSTSSSSGEIMSDDSDSSEVILDSSDLSSSSSSSESRERRYRPKSSEERKGWRKWHRKCTPCPDDMIKHWKDPSILWICGGYQRARRSFKSECMMYYRNCQDGTMFVKIHDHRCNPDDSKEELPHGLHFFYEYKEKSSEHLSSADFYD